MNKVIDSSQFHLKPAWFKIVNGIWKSTYSIGTEIKIEKDSIIKNARNQTGFHDLGDFWDEPFDRLIESINKEARLHPIGRFISLKRLENLVMVRLRAEHYFKKFPEILDQELYPVTMILGLQRTGTTKLQRLLSQDPNTRSLKSWEALNPAPINGDEKDGKNRIKMARLSERALKMMSPGFFAIHPVEHLEPEEDVLLLDVSFMSTTAEATMNVPSYSSWLEQVDQSYAYDYSAKLLKLLQWQKPAKRWVLKTPHHLEFADLVNRFYGDVQFVWTHRNIHEAIPSFLSMLAYSRSLFSNDVDPKELAAHWVRKIGYMLSKALEFRNEGNNNQNFVDVNYDRLVDDSIWVLNSIYQHRDNKLDEFMIDKLLNKERISPKNRFGKHIYRYVDFKIDQNFVDGYTMEYQEFIRGLK